MKYLYSSESSISKKDKIKQMNQVDKKTCKNFANWRLEKSDIAQNWKCRQQQEWKRGQSSFCAPVCCLRLLQSQPC